MESSQLQDECEKTLDHLPTNKSFLVEKELQYKYLTGNRKNQKGTISSNNASIIFSNGEKIRMEVKDNKFYFPSSLEILCKTANQVLSGHLSDKIQLENGMEISLQEIKFEVKLGSLIHEKNN